MGVKKRWMNRLQFRILCLLMIGLGGTALYFSPVGQSVCAWGQGVKQSVVEKAHWQLASDVVVMGHKRTDLQDIITALQLQQHQSMGQINLDEKKQQLEKLPWVKSAIVERRLPNQLLVTLDEKTPIAYWQNQGQYYLLDEHAEPIIPIQKRSDDLILVVGPDAPEHLLELLTTLDQFPEISEKVMSAQRIEKRRWNLYLFDVSSGLEILLPQENMQAALNRLSLQNKKDNLFKKDIASIDIRLNDRIIVRAKSVSKKKAQK